MEHGLDGDAVSAASRVIAAKGGALEILRKTPRTKNWRSARFNLKPPRTTRERCTRPRRPRFEEWIRFYASKAAAALEEEKRARVAAAFLENIDDFDRRHRRTIPEPFSVAENIDEKAESRRKALAEERVRREMAECTFAPDTSRSSSRARR